MLTSYHVNAMHPRNSRNYSIFEVVSQAQASLTAMRHTKCVNFLHPHFF